MTVPVHSHQIHDERQALAPYNFVPLPNTIRYARKPPSQGYYAKDLLTGTIECTLTNSTPMYVRAAQTPVQFEKGEVSHEPFYYGEAEDKKEQLIIPGSSLRGMLRTLVEVVSHSRISPVSDKQLFYRSVENTSMGETYRERMKDKVRAGFFHRGASGAYITPTIAARVSREEIRREFKVRDIYKDRDEDNKPIRASSPKKVARNELQRQTVYVSLNADAHEQPARFFHVLEFSREPQNDLEPAVLVITGDMKVRAARDGTKKEKREFVFLQEDSGKSIPIEEEQLELFEDRDQLTQFQKNAFHAGTTYEGTLQNGDPVFYLVGATERDVIGFGRAYMFRLPYKRSPLGMLPDELKGDPEKYDLAEALFGYVPQEKKGRGAVASRLRVSDAVFQEKIEEALLDEVRLKVLSSPKPTAFQHYLTQSKPNQPDRLSHYDSPPETTTLRGHKFYWHKGAVSADDYKASDKVVNEDNKTVSPPVKPIREGQTFTFQIAFENLYPEELGALLWVLDKAGDEAYRLKIGMGKPYGLGSIAIHATVTLEDRMQRYQKLLDGENWHVVPEASVEKATDARNAFARWLFDNPDATFEEVDQVSRIQELLALLSWKEHPAPQKTRYMDLEEFAGRKHMLTGETGHFPKRPVLPTPRNVFGNWLKNKPTIPGIKTSAPAQPDRPVRNRVRPMPVTVPPAGLKSGDAILATVIDAPRKGAIILHCEHHGEEDICVIREDYRGPDRYREGVDILLLVVKAEETQGGWVVECEKY
jgi:CRISPR-associated protein (TIGR03986 family)